MGSNQKKEYITYQKKRVATIITPDLRSYGPTFFTENERSLQVGTHHAKAGYEWKPHTHPKRHICIETPEEVLYIIRGTICVTFYTKDKTVIDKRTIRGGDIIILHSLGHGLTALEDSEIIEVKHGPYAQTNKLFFNSNDSSK